VGGRTTQSVAAQYVCKQPTNVWCVLIHVWIACKLIKLFVDTTRHKARNQYQYNKQRHTYKCHRASSSPHYHHRHRRSTYLSPPTSKQARKSVNRPRSAVNRKVCTASSRVGERMTARAPTRGECSRRRWKSGIRNAAVLPDPVRAIATVSRPSMITGILLR
jgi:hypothetical protein